MGSAIAGTLPFAVGVAISPIPIIGVILILFSRRARTNGPAFVAGWLLALLAIGGVTLFVADGGNVDMDKSASDASDTLKTVLGIVLLLLAHRQWRKRPQAGEQVEAPAWMASIESFSPAKSFGIGAVLGFNPKNLVLVTAGAVTIAQEGLASADEWVVLVVFVLMASVSVVGSVAYYLVAGKAAERQLDTVREWMLQNNAAVMTVLLLVFGVILLSQGASGLLD
jgi:hypothetical protein